MGRKTYVRYARQPLSLARSLSDLVLMVHVARENFQLRALWVTGGGDLHAVITVDL